MLPCFSKLLEHILHNIIYNFLVDNKILYENHFSVPAAHFTEHAILQLASHIAGSFNSGKLMLGIFIDFSKIDHSFLIKNLEKYGTKNQSLNWFKSYLTLRKQCVHYGDTVTSLDLKKRGVP